MFLREYMGKNTLQAILIILIGFLLMIGMRLGEWVLIEPPTRLLICMVDKEGSVGNCKPFSDYIKKET